MALPTDVQTYTALQLNAAAIAGSVTKTIGTQSSTIAVADPTATRFNQYNDQKGNGVHSWRCMVILSGNDQMTPLVADFQIDTIVAAGDDMPTALKRLFCAAKIQLGIS